LDFAVSPFAVSLGIDVCELLGIVPRWARWQSRRLGFCSHSQLFRSLQLVYLN